MCTYVRISRYHLTVEAFGLTWGNLADDEGIVGQRQYTVLEQYPYAYVAEATESDVCEAIERAHAYAEQLRCDAEAVEALQRTLEMSRHNRRVGSEGITKSEGTNGQGGEGKDEDETHSEKDDTHTLAASEGREGEGEERTHAVSGGEGVHGGGNSTNDAQQGEGIDTVKARVNEGRMKGESSSAVAQSNTSDESALAHAHTEEKQ